MDAFAIPPFTIVDFVVLILLAIGTVVGLIRGLSGELARAVAVVVAILMGLFLFRPAGAYLEAHSRLGPNGAYAIALLVGVVLVLLVLFLVNLLLRQFIEWTFKGRGERLGGALAGLLRTAFTLALIYLLVLLWNHPYLVQHLIEDSIIGRKASALVAPFYRDLTEDHPDWNLPGISEDVIPGEPEDV